MSRRSMTSTTWLQVLFGLGVAGLVWSVSKQGSVAMVILLASAYLLLLRFGTVPLARIIARAGYSIRWKFELAIIAIAVLFLSVGLISFDSMDFMHVELHKIEDLGPNRPAQVLMAVEALEGTQHGALFSMMPYLSAMGVLVGAAIGAAMAWSVIAPVRRMGEAMQKIGSGDFTQLVEVKNRDELGELAESINRTALDLSRLQEVTQAELRGARLIQDTLLPPGYAAAEGGA